LSADEEDNIEVKHSPAEDPSSLEKKSSKKVAWADKDSDEDELAPVKKQIRKLSQAEQQGILARLSQEFVKKKMEKLNFGSRLYLWLNRTFVEQIMFKNDKENLTQLLEAQSKGGVDVPTELEQIMLEEAKEIISKRYDNREGADEITALMIKASQGKNLLSITDLDRKIKLKKMHLTWAFTRPSSIFFRLIETFFYILISNTQGLIYLCMISSMYINAGLISLFYPLAVFGYAMMEETRPKKEFWTLVRRYTTVILFIKFFTNLAFFDAFLNGSRFGEVSANFKFGIYNYDTFFETVIYMSPEVLIIVFIMLNEIHLKLIGMYYKIEEDWETIDDGIQRNMANGDPEIVAENKKMKANMVLSEYFMSTAEQINNEKRLRDDDEEEAKIEFEKLHKEIKMLEDTREEEELIKPFREKLQEC
jgi:hypothetical protein